MSLFNRAEVIDKNFTLKVENEDFPLSISPSLVKRENIKKTDLISIFESQVTSRHIDIIARKLKDRGKCFYTIGSSGHEGNAVFGNVFSHMDIAFLHYRSAPFYLERSKKLDFSTPIYDIALSFLASSDDPISGGRHKVIGSLPLNIPPQTSTIASHLPKAVGAAFSIDRASDLDIKDKILKKDSVVLCSFGDASINHASALTAFNTARWIIAQGGHVPIIFICEDNGMGISVPTQRGWIENNFSKNDELKYIKADGLNMIDLMVKSREAYKICRLNRTPVFLHMETIRLMGHAGSDVEMGYRKLKDIEKDESNDPLLHSARILIDNKFLSKEEVLVLYKVVRKQVNHVFNSAMSRPKLIHKRDIVSSLIPNQTHRKKPKYPSEKIREKFFGKEFNRLSNPQNMSKLINYSLFDLLLTYENTLIFGEDVAQKGGVYNVTNGLSKSFGVRRVFNSPLDETSILGFAIGLSHNGFIPIPEIQFLAYFHNAEDQIRGEAATLSFFSGGKFTNPMVLRVPGLAYQKGFGGHFHNDNSLTIFRDIPGIILAVPSNGEDAVKMLRTSVREAYLNGRIVIFIEPIALYMTKDLIKEKDGKWLFNYPSLDEEIPIGKIKSYGDGNTLTIITYGNGLYHSLRAKNEIENKVKKKIKIIDLRWLSSIDMPNLIKSIGDCKNILIVDECRRTGCHGEKIYLDLNQATHSNLNIRLHAAEDCFIPLGVAATSTLPSKESIFKNAVDIING